MRLNFRPSFNLIDVPGIPLCSFWMKMPSNESYSHDYENYKVISFSKTGNTKIFDEISP